MYKKTCAFSTICILLFTLLCASFYTDAKAVDKQKGDSNLTKIVEISTGSSHSLAIKADGTLWAWGCNQYGQLGDGTQFDRTIPVQIGNDSDWYKIAAGTYHSLAIKKDGTLWAWGYNSIGQLGDGTGINKLKPIKISTSKDWKKIAAGGNYSLAIKKQGSLWGSGDINRVSLDSKSISKSKFIQIGNEVIWDSISISSGHVLALKKDGTVWAWGAGGNGQFGNGTDSSNIQFAVQVGIQTDWIKISAGEGYSLGQKKDGSLWRWGHDSSNVDLLTPEKVGNDTDWVSFTTSLFTSAIKADGSIWTWGYDNNHGSISELRNMVKAKPFRINNDNDWQIVESGNQYSVALKKDGTLWSWGNNRNGELGYGNTIIRTKPVQVGDQMDWQKVSAGYNHTLSIKEDGSLWAWGSNIYSEIGTMSFELRTSGPVHVGNSINWQKTVATGFVSLALTKDGTLWGWGSNNLGMIYSNKKPIVYTPEKIGNDSEWVDVSSSSTLVFGLKKDGTIWVWGMDPNTDLFDKTKAGNDVKLEPLLVGQENDWIKISAGGTHGTNYVMALKKDGSLWGWGFENYCFGNENTYEDGHNFLRIGSSNDWKDVATGSNYSVAIKKDNSLWSWNMYKNTEKNTIDTAPIRIGKDSDWMRISTLGQHVLLLKNDGSLWGFGKNYSGQIGDGTRIDRANPVLIDSKSKWKYISAGESYSTAIKSDGTLWAWGDNYENRLGVESPDNQAQPMEILLGQHESSYNHKALAYNKKIYVSVGKGGIICFSKNGVNWTKTKSGTINNLNSITWNGNKFVVVGDGGVVLTSSDGEKWSSFTSGVNENLGSIVWGDGLFIAVGEHGTILLSKDAVDWKYYGYKKNILFSRIIWTGMQYVVVGENTSDSFRGVVLASQDGKTWSESSLDEYTSLIDIAWDGKKYVGMEVEGSVWLSEDLAKWTKTSYETAGDMGSIIWNGNMFVITGAGSMITSQNGTDWVEHNSDKFNFIECIVWADDKYVAVGRNGQVLISKDGLDWFIAPELMPIENISDDISKIKAAFIFIGNIKDGGWTEAHYNGMEYLKEKLGVETFYYQNIPESTQVYAVIKDAIDNQGCNLIFATSYGYADYTIKLAKEYPKVRFFNCTGTKILDNMSCYNGRMYEARYLSGIVAGLNTKKDKLGFVASYKTNEVISEINAFTLGVQSVNPKAKVFVKWVNSWGYPERERTITIDLINKGCDVITQHSLLPVWSQLTAQEKGVYTIGYGVDTKDIAPMAYMTAPIWNWGVYYVEQVKSIMDGTWKAENYNGGLKEGIVDLAPLTANAPKGTEAKVNSIRKKIIEGGLEIFKGPVYNQKGVLKIKKGEFLKYNEINGKSMDWFVKGVESVN